LFDDAIQLHQIPTNFCRTFHTVTLNFPHVSEERTADSVFIPDLVPYGDHYERDALFDSCSSPLLPFSVAEDHQCISVGWSDYKQRNWFLQIPLPVLRRFAGTTADGTVTLPWEAWSQDVYVDDDSQKSLSNPCRGLRSGRYLKFSTYIKSHTIISLFDVNPNRAKHPLTTAPATKRRTVVFTTVLNANNPGATLRGGDEHILSAYRVRIRYLLVLSPRHTIFLRI
jgi:hypothetical protein